MLIFTVLFVCVVCLAYYQIYWRRRRVYELAAKVPTYKHCLPLIGHGYYFLSTRSLKVIQDVSKFANENEGVATLWLNSIPYFMIANPTDAATVLNSCLNKNYMYRFFDPWVKGLLNLNLPLWTRHHRLLSPTFNPQVLRTFRDTFNKNSRCLAEKLGENLGAYIDVGPAISNAALDTICETSIGTSLNGEPVVDDTYREALHTMLGVIMKRITDVPLHFDFIFNLTQTKKIQDKACKVLHESSEKFIEKRRLALANNNYKGVEEEEPRFKPFIQLMLELADKNAFNNEELRSEVQTIIGTGHDSTAQVLTYIFITLGSYPEVQEKVYQEMREIFGDSDRDVEKEDMSKMVYLEAVIQETIRIYPHASVIVRQIDNDVKITNYTLPAGSCAFVSVWGIHYGPWWGADAHVFRPERWLDPASLPPQPAAFGGFSYGKRRCIAFVQMSSESGTKEIQACTENQRCGPHYNIMLSGGHFVMGKSYAMQSMKTTMSHVVRKYKLTADCSKLELFLDIVLRPISGHHVLVEAR